MRHAACALHSIDNVLSLRPFQDAANGLARIAEALHLAFRNLVEVKGDFIFYPVGDFLVFDEFCQPVSILLRLGLVDGIADVVEAFDANLSRKERGKRLQVR